MVNTEDFDAIFRDYYSRVYGFLLKMCNYSMELAEELAQETFFQAYLSLGSFRGGCQLGTWLIQIAKNRFYMSLRRQKPKQAPPEDTYPPANGSENGMEDKVIQRELLLRARQIIDGMSPNMSEVMLYRIYSDLPYAQIAALLKISEGSAKVLFHRGKELLRKKLKEEYGYEI